MYSLLQKPKIIKLFNDKEMCKIWVSEMNVPYFVVSFIYFFLEYRWALNSIIQKCDKTRDVMHMYYVGINKKTVRTSVAFLANCSYSYVLQDVFFFFIANNNNKMASINMQVFRFCWIAAYFLFVCCFCLMSREDMSWITNFTSYRL